MILCLRWGKGIHLEVIDEEAIVGQMTAEVDQIIGEEEGKALNKTARSSGAHQTTEGEVHLSADQGGEGVHLIDVIKNEIQEEVIREEIKMIEGINKIKNNVE